MLLGQALHESGAPAGVINVVNGDPEAMGQAFLNDKRVRKLAFTGSPRVGKLLMDGASRTLTRLALELGGNAPVIVFPDSPNLARLAKLAALFKTRNVGQVCIAPQRFYVHGDVVEEFTAAVVEAMGKLRVGHGLEEGVQVGPLINERQRQRVEELVASGVQAGAKVLAGGERLDRRGYFFAPTVVTDVKPGTPLPDEEIFGPVLPITPFRGAQEVLDRYARRPGNVLRRPVQHVRVGPPVDLSDLYERADDPRAHTEATRRVMAAITDLLAQIRGEQPPDRPYDMARDGSAKPRPAGRRSRSKRDT